MRCWRGAVACAAGIALFLITGCHNAPSTERGLRANGGVTQKTYHLRGTIVRADPASGEVVVNADAIQGFMPAMTMPYRLAQPSVISELHPGDQITAEVLVNNDPDGTPIYLLDSIDVIAQADANRLPEVQYHVPRAGETVPDYTLLDQSGKHIDLKQFRGKVLLMTFIYTRCPFPDFCVRMSDNFEKIDGILAQNKQLYGQTHLLSVSFDPEYDTPAVLRSYGGGHTGRYTKENFHHWTFAAPSLAELPKMEQYFDVGVSGTSPSTLTHSLSTVLIAKDGKILDWYPSNTWDPAAVAEQMRKAAQ